VTGNLKKFCKIFWNRTGPKLEIMVEQQDNMISERDKQMIEIKQEVKPII
jgi:hypothetical protein